MPEPCGASAFYIPAEKFSGGIHVVFDPGESAHIARVLRLSAGEMVEVLDGCGGVHRVEIVTVDPRRVDGRVVKSISVPEPQPAVSVALAVGRKERLRFAVEKLAELGCRRLWPLECEHLQFPGSLGSQVKKLQATSVAALKQSRRPHLTAVEQPLKLDDLLILCKDRELTPVFCQPGGPDSCPLDTWAAGAVQDKEVVIVVGPEGGFSGREAEMISAQGHSLLDLGRYWLRSETAAIAGFTLLAQCLRKEFSVGGGLQSELR